MKKRITAAILAVVTVISLAACSSKAVNDMVSSADKAENWNGAMAPAEAAGGYGYDYDVEYPAADIGAGGSGVEGVEERKRIVYIDVRMETLDYDTTISQLKSLASEVGGYIDSSEEYNAPAYGYGARRAHFKFRIPQTRASGFADALPAIGHVLSQSEHGDDVTEQYFDIETRLRSLELQRDKYMELLDRAEDVSYIIELTRALSDVIYQIESYTTTLNRLDSLVSYSTVTVDIDEVIEQTKAPEEVTFGSRVADAFTGSIEAFVAAVQWVAIAFVAVSPFLIIAAVIAVIVIVIVAVRRRKRK